MKRTKIIAAMATIMAMSTAQAMTEDSSLPNELEKLRQEMEAQTQLGIQLQQETLQRLRAQRAAKEAEFKEQNTAALKQNQADFMASLEESLKPDPLKIELNLEPVDLGPIGRGLAVEDSEPDEELASAEEANKAEVIADTSLPSEAELERIALLQANDIASEVEASDELDTLPEPEVATVIVTVESKPIQTSDVPAIQSPDVLRPEQSGNAVIERTPVSLEESAAVLTLDTENDQEQPLLDNELVDGESIAEPIQNSDDDASGELADNDLATEEILNDEMIEGETVAEPHEAADSSTTGEITASEIEIAQEEISEDMSEEDMTEEDIAPETIAAVEEVSDDASEIVEAALDAEEMTDEEAADLAQAIDATEDQVESLVEEVDQAQDKTLEEKLAEAQADLEKAKEALKGKEDEIAELNQDNKALTNAYCEQKSTLTDLTERVEEFEQSTFGQLNERFDMLAQLMMMNMMAQRGPQYSFDPGLAELNRPFQYFGLENGVRLLTLNDFFEKRSLGMGSGPVTNMYIGGDFYGGAYNHNPVQGSVYTGGYSYNDGANQATGLNFPTIGNTNMPHAFNFGQVNMQGRNGEDFFNVPYRPAGREQIKANFRAINNGEQIFRRSASETVPTESTNMIR